MPTTVCQEPSRTLKIQSSLESVDFSEGSFPSPSESISGVSPPSILPSIPHKPQPPFKYKSRSPIPYNPSSEPLIRPEPYYVERHSPEPHWEILPSFVPAPLPLVPQDPTLPQPRNESREIINSTEINLQQSRRYPALVELECVYSIRIVFLMIIAFALFIAYQLIKFSLSNDKSLKNHTDGGPILNTPRF